LIQKLDKSENKRRAMSDYRFDLLANLTVRQLIAEYNKLGIDWKEIISRGGRGRGGRRGTRGRGGRDDRKRLIASSPRPADLADQLNRLQPNRLTYPVAAVKLAGLIEVESPQVYELTMFDNSSADHISSFLNIYSIPSNLNDDTSRERLVNIAYLLLILSYSRVMSKRDDKIIQTDYFIPLYTAEWTSLESMAQKWSLPVKESRGKLVRSLIENKFFETFPFNYLTYDDSTIMFQRLKSYSPIANREKYRLTGYYSRSFDPRIAISIDGGTEGEIYLSTKSTESMVPEFDGISDHFTEEVRMSARRSDFPSSPLDFWRRNLDWIKTTAQKLVKADIDSSGFESISTESIQDQYREVIWINAQWATRFKPSWAKFLILVVYPEPSGLSWLDISAGWGDRLITAMSLDMNYRGYDPNIELKRGHDRMIEMFGDQERHQVIYEPFETATIEGSYDLILTSPPFFDLEIYSEEGSQSIERYNRFEHWLDSFLLKSLDKAWRSLKANGFMMIHISDSRYHKVVDPVYNYMGRLSDSYYLGVIGLAGESDKYRPVWIWRKTQ